MQENGKVDMIEAHGCVWLLIASTYSAFHEDFPLSCEIGYRMQKSLI